MDRSPWLTMSVFHRPVILVNDVVELFALLDAEYQPLRPPERP
jgi:hypothetical protein